MVTALLALALLALPARACPTPKDGLLLRLLEGTLYASIESGKMAALDPTPEAGADCENFEDDDGDGGVNEGCERAGQKSESGGDCKNVENDDGQGNNPDDNVVNDGCPPYYAIWTFPPNTKEGDQLDLKGIYSAPLVDGEVVYFGAYDGNVYALNADDGTPRWRFETDDPIVAPLAFKDGILYIGSTDSFLYAIDTTTCVNICPAHRREGIPRGRRDLGGAAARRRHHLRRHDVRASSTRWTRRTSAPSMTSSFETKSGLTMDPTLVDDDTLLVGGIDKELFALDLRDGRPALEQAVQGRQLVLGQAAGRRRHHLHRRSRRQRARRRP